MEVKIPKEIRDYQETIYFGLSVRQFVFSMSAIVLALGVYFIFKPVWGTEVVSWLCILCAAPFAAMGFYRYNGLTFEQFVQVWIRSQILMPHHLTFKSQNLFARPDLISRLKGEKYHV